VKKGFLDRILERLGAISGEKARHYEAKLSDDEAEVLEAPSL